ncbi:MAG: c-type cytochrome [Steroidobacteraceae bacterium]|nr:c-type cytochrome [Steroidobacteraceae bacterium]
MAFAALALAAPACADGYEWRLPRGFPEPAVPADNPMSAEKVALGARLFSDTRLSASGRHSCESCHSPYRAFTDGLPRSRGDAGETLPLNAPTLLNVAYNPSLGWNDPAVRTLEQQMAGPLFNEHPRELGLKGREAAVERVLGEDAAMASGFAAAFPGEDRPVAFGNVVRAIAAYQRTLISGDSPFDRYVFGGDSAALSAAQKRGLELFSGRAGCVACHGGINFAGPWVDRDAPDAEPAFADAGTGVKVRVPTLRNVARTGPYLHDGRLATLDDVLARYEVLAHESPDPRLARPGLTTDERDALRAFLDSLTDAP